MEDFNQRKLDGQGVAVSATVGTREKAEIAEMIARTLQLEYKCEELVETEGITTGTLSLRDVNIRGLVWEKRTKAEAERLQSEGNPEVEKAVAQSAEALERSRKIADRW